MDIRAMGDLSKFSQHGSIGADSFENRMMTTPVSMPQSNNIKTQNIPSNKSKVKESFLLRNVYKNDMNTKMLLAKKRREGLEPTGIKNNDLIVQGNESFVV